MYEFQKRLSPVVGAGVVVIAGGDVRHELLDALLDLSEARLFLLEALLEEATEVGRVRRRRGQRRRRHRDLQRGKRLQYAHNLHITHSAFFHALQMPGLAQRCKDKYEHTETAK